MIPKGLFDPKNAVKSTGGFKEGFVQVDSSCFKVHRGRTGEGEPERSPTLVMAWGVTRLDEDAHDPLTTEEGDVITEEITFGLGGKALSQAHPGRADSAEDEEIEDVGVEVGASGPTIYLINKEWFPHEKSAIIHLYDSLKARGVKPEDLERVWAPDFVGSVFRVKSQGSGEKMQRPDLKHPGMVVEQEIMYKVVDKIVKGPRTAKSAAKSKANGVAKSSEAEKLIAPLMDAISDLKAGESMTRKALKAQVSRMLNESSIDPKMHVDIMQLTMNDAWLKANGGKYDFIYEDDRITFGTAA